MVPNRSKIYIPEDCLPGKYSELCRRGFIIGAAASLASTVIGCSPTTTKLSAGGKGAYRTGSGSHRSYRDFLASLRLKHISAEAVLQPHYRSRNSLPPKSLWSNISTALRVADKMAAKLGSPIVRINSAYRSPSYNRRIGGAPASQHMRNTALDIKFACGAYSASKVARRLRSEGFFAGGVGIYSSFLHIDTRGTNETWWG